MRHSQWSLWLIPVASRSFIAVCFLARNQRYLGPQMQIWEAKTTQNGVISHPPKFWAAGNTPSSTHPRQHSLVLLMMTEEGLKGPWGSTVTRRSPAENSQEELERNPHLKRRTRECRRKRQRRMSSLSWLNLSKSGEQVMLTARPCWGSG